MQKYGTVAPFFTVYFHLYVNPAWWDGLPDDVRGAIAEAAAKAEQDSIPLTEQTAEEAIVALREEGMEIHVQTPEEVEAFKAVVQKPVLDAFLASSPDAAGGHRGRRRAVRLTPRCRRRGRVLPAFA
ncbi:MAG: hypothetical protein M5U09_20745 [Gammaproteobacteria bacterium]|nr:hypothetical protein [Gammaproteobacteria bacterium]